MRNPFEKMPTILFPDELIDKAFRRAEKAASAATPRGKPFQKAREREELRVRTVSQVLRDNLRKFWTELQVFLPYRLSIKNSWTHSWIGTCFTNP